MRRVFMIAIVVVIRIRLVMLRVRGFSVLMRFEHHMHVRIKKENQIRHQRDRAGEAQPNRFVFSRSHSKSVSSRLVPIIGRHGLCASLICKGKGGSFHR